MSPESADFIDIALEGVANHGPKPTIPELNTVFDKLAELQLKRAKEQVKAAASSSSRARGRGRRGRGRPDSAKGKEPAP